MQVHAGNQRFQEDNRIEDIFSVSRMCLENLVLFVSEFPRFVQICMATELAANLKDQMVKQVITGKKRTSVVSALKRAWVLVDAREEKISTFTCPPVTSV